MGHSHSVKSTAMRTPKRPINVLMCAAIMAKSAPLRIPSLGENGQIGVSLGPALRGEDGTQAVAQVLFAVAVTLCN